jgi:hypothetical protein
MPSPIGTWNLQGDFLDGTLIIETIDATGNLTQVTLDGEQLLGFWNEDAQKLTFLRTNSPPNSQATPEFLARLIVFTGYLISNEAGSLAFAGTYQSFQGSGATSGRSVFGWYALPQ